MDRLKNKNLIKKILLTLGVLTLVGVAAVLIVPEITNSSFAFATATPAAKPTAVQSLDQTISKTLQGVQDVVSIGLVLLNYLIWPILIIIGALMNNTLIIGPGMEQSLLSVWREVRNIVNILFAVILLIIAIYNVLGLGEEGPLSGYAFKKILPKFIVAIILVNFSFTISKLVLDSVDLFTNAIFAIPKKGIEALQANQDPAAVIANYARKICASIYVEKLQKEVGGKMPLKTQMCKSKTEFTADAVKFFTQTINSNSAALMLAINMGQLHEQMSVSEILQRMEESQKSDDRAVIKLSDFLVNSLFSLIFFIVYTITFAVLALVLLVRVVVLWLCVALSPLIALMYVLPEELTSSFGEGLKFQDKFLKHAFAPVVIAFTMSIGFFMLTAYQMIGGVTPGRPEAFQLGVIISGITDIHKLIIAVGAIVVVWIGTFEAASGTVVTNFTEGLKDTFQTWGKEIATAWKYATIIPVITKGKDGKPGESSISPNALLQAFHDPKGTVKGAVEKLTGGGAAAAGGAAILNRNDTLAALREIAQGGGNARPDKWEQILPSISHNQEDPETRNKFLEALKKTDATTIQKLKARDWLHRDFDTRFNAKKGGNTLAPGDMPYLLGPNATQAPAAPAPKDKEAGEGAAAPATPAAFASNEELTRELSAGDMNEAKFARLLETAKSGSTEELKDIAKVFEGLKYEKVKELGTDGMNFLLSKNPGQRKTILEALKPDTVTNKQIDAMLAAIQHGEGSENYKGLNSTLQGIVRDVRSKL